MALVKGTNCGFVTEAPEDDPDGEQSKIIDYYCRAIKVTAPDNITITEIGWYCNNATQEANFEVAIYSHNSENNFPDASIGKYQTNAKGTTAGWKRATELDIELIKDTIYWIVIQLDNTSTTTLIDSAGMFGERDAEDTSESTLQDPWNTTTGADHSILALYALYSGAAGTNTQINIGDAWKSIAGMQINIGDVWKAIASAKINIGDVWKVLDIA